MHYELLSLKFNTSFKRLFLQPLLTSPVPLLLTDQRCSSLPPPEERAASPKQLFLVVIKHFLLALLVLSWHTQETWNILKNTPQMTFNVFFSSRRIANIAVPFGIKIFSPDILWEGKKKKEIWGEKKAKAGCNSNSLQSHWESSKRLQQEQDLLPSYIHKICCLLHIKVVKPVFFSCCF